MASFTITEKGYALATMAGTPLPEVEADYGAGPDRPRSSMGKVAALAYVRYRSGKLPFAFVSMDNMSHNGDKLRDAVLTIAREWETRKLAEPGFSTYLADRGKVGFPLTMIDKITPRPSETVKNALAEIGFADAEIICTSKKAWIAPFVNAEGPQYLVMEDVFPAGRPPLEKAGVLFTDRVTVDKVEKMKVCTCLNPLHTALAVFGCVLGFTSIAAEMANPVLRRLVERIGYDEGLPVVVNPGIIDPNRFIKEVLEVRFANPYIPDTPQRIASDTSQKVGIRFGETLKAYRARPDLDPAALRFIPLAIAGWCRYLLGVDDTGAPFELSPDPMLDQLRTAVSGIRFGDADGVPAKLRPILSNAKLFGSDLYDLGLGVKIEGYFQEMIAGPGAVKATLEKYVG
jgi:fructuronate reductase